MAAEADGLHRGQPIEATGAPIESAAVAAIMLHGRGASAADILSLATAIGVPEVAYLAPVAAGHTWYPYSFLQPVERNEPWLSSALAVIGDVLARAAAAGIPTDRAILLGFSQGACLALEFAARNALLYGGVVGLSGGLIGPPGTPRDYPGSLKGTPVFLGCSDVDAHIPWERVEESAETMRRLGGEVTLRKYPGMGHTVVEDEVSFVRHLLGGLIKG